MPLSGFRSMPTLTNIKNESNLYEKIEKVFKLHLPLGYLEEKLRSSDNFVSRLCNEDDDLVYETFMPDACWEGGDGNPFRHCENDEEIMDSGNFFVYSIFALILSITVILAMSNAKI